MRTRSSIFQNVDLPLVGTFLFLVLAGWANIYAATLNDLPFNLFDFSQSYVKQMVWIICALILGSVILIIDSKFYEGFANIIYGIAILLLIFVLVGGKEIKGAKSWFVMGGVSFQPSEIAKYATALVIAKFLSAPNFKINTSKSRAYIGLTLAIPALLIVAQPDPGSALVYGAFVLVLFREGLPGGFLLAGLLSVILFVISIILKTVSLTVFDYVVEGKYIFIAFIGGVLTLIHYMIPRYKRVLMFMIGVFVLASGYIMSVDYIFENALSERHRNRINELLGITFDPRGTGYNVYQSKIAIGSGGFAGKGYLEGTQTKYEFVPEQSTDFIFCTVGEEWGFLGSALLISVFIWFLFRLIIVAERQKNKFSRIYGYSVACIFFFHLAINVGMTIGLAPVIGIPLPFFSYGGSSLWSFTILLFTFLRLDAERTNILS